jgi:CheY-like chemotaxis protein
MAKRILVIDDDAAIRKSFLLSLEDSGYVVDTAESGAQGIQMEEETAYDLIFLDLKMPGLNGVQTLRRIRKRNPGIPIYIITAFHNDFFEELKIAQNDHMEFELLRKPIGGDQILALTQGVLNGPVPG